ncbi:hypothetical protein AB1Y20_001805 [Prymnesium parvum]|uniref:Uncharacterized protein n=1 Tax=Prymnesium parvum TaxID=97485 RepID=A0AB34KAK3_PRYPA
MPQAAKPVYANTLAARAGQQVTESLSYGGFFQVDPPPAPDGASPRSADDLSFRAESSSYGRWLHSPPSPPQRPRSPQRRSPASPTRQPLYSTPPFATDASVPPLSRRPPAGASRELPAEVAREALADASREVPTAAPVPPRDAASRPPPRKEVRGGKRQTGINHQSYFVGGTVTLRQFEPKAHYFG